ncbi:metal ABC transporter substrate-binding protein [Mediterraneibacter glycyrrhizinilyticus]|uniref:metal ABC transporter substrate-binding protein n=1 Tax=Mediterraneibacter glycyrrhizinilyticus TaxID=342942 RepID=UPI001FAED80D|nr:metal ABC transporter substrate-binding protein [Mediterraneibacter glycyrrhizinilyticus]
MTDMTGRSGKRKRRGIFRSRALAAAGCVLLSGSLLAGCGGTEASGSGAKGQEDEGKISVVTTIFPQYDFVRQIAGDQVNLKMLLKPGEETHSYEPTPQDIIAIQNSNVFIYVGGENDAWVEEILESMPESDMVTLKLMDCVDTVEEEEVEGMQSEPGHSHEEEEEHVHEGEEEEETHSIHEIDEHVWTSPENASAIVGKIRDILIKEDPSNSGFYEKNAEEYQERLAELDQEFRDVVSNAKRNLLIFGDRFPFRYFADAYGLDYYAAFPGCASDTEPSAATMAFLINKVKEEKVPAVLKMELSNDNIANAIAEATGTEVKTFYSCHNLTAEEFENGETYLSMMEKNVETLKEVLNGWL